LRAEAYAEAIRKHPKEHPIDAILKLDEDADVEAAIFPIRLALANRNAKTGAPEESEVRELFLQKQAQKQEEKNHKGQVKKIRNWIIGAVVALVTVLAIVYAGFKVAGFLHLFNFVSIWPAVTIGTVIVGIVIWGIIMAFVAKPLLMTFITIMTVVGILWFAILPKPHKTSGLQNNPTPVTTLEIRKAIPLESATAQVRKAISIRHKVTNRAKHDPKN
jgi:hypothetical protein